MVCLVVPLRGGVPRFLLRAGRVSWCRGLGALRLKEKPFGARGLKGAPLSVVLTDPSSFWVDHGILLALMDRGTRHDVLFSHAAGRFLG